ncbi:MAG: hypothetical protein U0325_07695 [Polyangiales bacterium]
MTPVAPLTVAGFAPFGAVLSADRDDSSPAAPTRAPRRGETSSPTS